MTMVAEPLTIKLRDYQEDQLDAIMAAFKDERKTALVVAPTGTGKTLAMIELARRMGVKTLILAHRERLLNQTKAKMLIMSPTADIGIVGFDHAEWGHQITLGGVQTLRFPERLERLARECIELLIIDEVHHDSNDNSYRKIREAVWQARVVGFTATDERLDGKSLTPVYGTPVWKRHIMPMIRKKWLCNLRCVMIRTSTSLDKVRKIGNDYSPGSLSKAINRADRNEIIVKQSMEVGNPDDPMLCFCADIKHAEALCKAYVNAGYKATCVSSHTPDEEREEREKGFETGKYTIMCNVDVYGEGADMDMRKIVLAAPTRSRAKFIQQIGRGTRLAPGKLECIIFDVTDNCLIHSLEPLSLEDALDMPITDGQTALDADKEYQKKNNSTPEEDKDKPSTSIEDGNTDGEIVTHDVQFTPVPWKRLSNGAYEAKIKHHRVALWPAGGGQYHVGVILKDHALGKPQGHIIKRSMPLGWAQAMAEQTARLLQNGKANLVDPSAPWRSHPITEAQRDRMMKAKIRIPAGCTKGQASDLMNERFSKRRA